MNANGHGKGAEKGVGHACEAETSMVLALRPEMVDIDRIGGVPVVLRHLLEAGARRIVVVRAITEASDPPAAAAKLKAKLLAVA